MRTIVLSVLFATGLCLLPPSQSTADVRPAKVFADHMVLQQELPINIWGTADKGERITVTLAGRSTSTDAGADGRWMLQLPAMKADGQSHTLTLKGKSNTVELQNVVLGEVWIASGQSNMGRGTVIAESDSDADIRFFYRYKTEQGVFPCEHDYNDNTVVGWRECSLEGVADAYRRQRRSEAAHANTYGEVAYVFAKEIHKATGVPVGVMNIAFAGSTASSWTPVPGIEAEYPFGQPIETRYYNHIPGVMYQTQLHPVLPLTIRGVIWYQGEDDGRNQQYGKTLKTMIESWRAGFGRPDLPFYMAQIAQTTYASGMQMVWEGEAWVMENVPHTGLAPSNDMQDAGLRIDEGDARIKGTGFPIAGGGNPHPPNKHLIAERLAAIALAKTYGRLGGREVFGPMYDSHKIEDGKVVIKFKYVGDGLTTDDGRAPDWFQVAPPLTREVYHPTELHYMLRLRQQMIPARAEIVGRDSVVVHLPPEMKEVFWVSYAWHALSRNNLRNSDGLSAIPFRLWEGVPPRPEE